MKLALVQYIPEWEDPKSNMRIIDRMLAEISDCDAVIFPELSLTGFTMNSNRFAEDIDGESMKYFMNLSVQKKIHVFAGIIEKDENRSYNALFHFDKMGLITAKYRKIHPFSYTKEDKYFFAGHETASTKIEQTKIGLSVCYDIRFPELFRYYGKERAEVIINIANWPVPRIHHYTALLRARAIENQCFVIGVNRTGKDPYHEYNGQSSVFDAMGNEILNCGEAEGIFIVELDIESVYSTRKKFPFLEDIKMI